MTYRQDWIRHIRRRAAQLGLDPAAALAVASAEGLSGAVGDGGHAFGPFQLNDAGGVLTNRPGNHRAFAESPQGIEWALQRIAQSGARGKRGRGAIEAIVRNFERPADPTSEIARALAMYGKIGGGVMPDAQASSGPSPSPQVDNSAARQQLALALIQQNQGGQKNFGALLDAIRAAHQQPPQARPAMPRPRAQNVAGSTGKPLSWLESLAPKFGLTVTSTTGGKHVPTSWHYKGRAVDYAGSPQEMAALMAYALGHPGLFREAFYDPAGRYVKNGSRVKGAIGGHSDHVHLAA